MFDLSTQNFEISDELQIRKILEKNTGFNWIFDKNDDKYAYDLKAWRYDVFKDGRYNKNFMGFIEIEVGNGWVDQWPENYYCVSFLYRKIYKFDWDKKEQIGLRKDADRAFYLKFNSSQTNCFCLKISDIDQIGTPSRRNKENEKYNYSFMEVDTNGVIWGVKNCIEYIAENFKMMRYNSK